MMVDTRAIHGLDHHGDARREPQYSKATPCVCWFHVGQRDEQSIKNVSHATHWFYDDIFIICGTS